MNDGLVYKAYMRLVNMECFGPFVYISFSG